MTVSESNPTPEQIAACERAMDGLEAQADIWADEINLVLIIKNIGNASRGLTDRMPRDIREGFINRQEANIDALVRQAYLEGFDRGGESRKAYDKARATAALSDQVVVPKEPTQAMLDAAWKATVNATPEQHLASQLCNTRQAHDVKMRSRYAAMLMAAGGEDVS